MKLIKINEKHFIIVDSSEINIGDWIFYPITKAILRWDGNMPLRNEGLKLTHSTIIYMFQDDILLLSLQEVEKLIYGYSIEEIALEKYPRHVFRKGEVGTDLSYLNRKSFTDGFKTHRELVKDKLFTIEDMEKAMRLFHDREIKTTDEIIQSLLPKEEWDIKFEQGKLVLL